jgi:hypothetical protein
MPPRAQSPRGWRRSRLDSASLLSTPMPMAATARALLMFVLALGALCAPIAHAAVAIPLPWQVGLKLEYDSTTVSEKVTRDVRRVATTRAVSTIEILAADDTGYVQSWRDRKARIVVEGNGPELAQEQRTSQQMLDRFADLSLEARLDDQGLYTGLRNWEVLAARMREVIAPVLLAQARAKPQLASVPEAELWPKLTPVLAQMTTQPVIDASLGRNASIYNLFTSPVIEAGKPVRYEDALQSPLSDHRIPAIGMFELIATDEQADTITIRWTQAIDPVKGRDAAWAMVEAITGAPLPAERTSLPTQLTLRDEATVVLHRGTGVIQRLQHERLLELGEQKRRTTWTMVLQTD